MSSTKTRNQSVDLWRLIAAFGVILIHLAPSTPSAELLTQGFLVFVVPFFYTISIFFLIGKMDTREVPLKNAVSLSILPVYLTWSLIYIAARNAKFYLTGEPFQWNLVDSFVLGSSSVHLYFIPNLLAFQAIAWFANEWFCKRRFQSSSLLGFVLLAGFIGYKFRFNLSGSIPFIATGLAYFIWAKLLRYLTKTLPTKTSALLAILGCTGIVAVHLASDQRAEFIAYSMIIAGLFFAWLSLTMPFSTGNAALKFAMGASLVIYVSHFLFLEVMEFGLDRVYPVAAYSIATKLLFGFVVLAATLTFVWIVRKIPIPPALRNCLIGER